MFALFERHPIVHSTRSPEVDLPEQQVLGSIEHVRSIPRSYMDSYLRQHGHRAIADKLVNERGLNMKIHSSLQRIQGQLENDLSEQFTDILEPLFRSKFNQDLKVEFDSVAENIFSDGVNWGRVLTFLRFSSEFAVRCINAHINIRASDVLDWTEAELVARFPQLVETDPQIARLLGSTETDGWHVDMSAVALTTGLIVTLVTAGLFTLKRIF